VPTLEPPRRPHEEPRDKKRGLDLSQPVSAGGTR
jgi:hypothetical protein